MEGLKQIQFVPDVLKVIFNPAAGKGRALRALGPIQSFLAEHAVPYELLTTQGAGHATELAAGTPEGCTVVAVGGDGTVHEVVKGLFSDGPIQEPPGRTLAVIPEGSGDDFAFSLGIARGDLEGALRRLVNPMTKLVDVGFVDGEPFVNSIGVGFDAEAAHQVRTSPKVFKGLAAYLYGVLAALGNLRPVAVSVTIDGVLVYEGASLLVAMQNGPRAGGSFMFSPNAANDDGKLDVLVAGKFGRLGAISILPRLMKGQHLSHERVHLFHGRHVVLEWQQPQRGHAEGEPLGPKRDYDVQLVCKGLRVIY